MGQFTLARRETADGTEIVITGDMDEGTDLSALAGFSGRRLIVDLGGLHRINSAGVAAWLEAIHRVSQACGDIRLRNVPEAFLVQHAMLHGFTGSATIDSVQVDYVCAACDHEQPMSFRRQEHFPEGRLAPGAPSCARCGGPMELDISFEGLEL